MEKRKCAKCGKSLMLDKDHAISTFAIHISTAKLGSRKAIGMMQRLAKPYKVNTEYPVCPKCLLDTFLKK